MPDTTEHKYPLSQKIITYILMPGASMVSFVLGMFFLKIGNVVLSGFLLLCTVWIAFLVAFGSLMCSSIIVSDEGIAARNYGRLLKSIRWRQIMKVKKLRRWNAGSRSYEDTFHIFDGDRSWLQGRMVNLRGPIVFTDKISGLRTLLNKINSYAHEYRFPLIVLDQEAAKLSSTKPVEADVAAF